MSGDDGCSVSSLKDMVVIDSGTTGPVSGGEVGVEGV